VTCKDINAKKPPPGQDWYYAGPHVMLVLPDGDRDALKDVGQQTGGDGGIANLSGVERNVPGPRRRRRER
jgi:hypothetical protein